MMSRLSVIIASIAAGSKTRRSEGRDAMPKRLARIADADREADRLAQDRAPGDAGHAPAHVEAEEDRQRDVGAVEHDLQEKTELALAAPQHVAEHRIVGEREGRAQQTDAHIGVHRREHPRLGAHEPGAAQRDQRRQQRERDTR